MNKKKLCQRVAQKTNVSEEIVQKIMEILEEEIKYALISGDQIHWGDFFHAWVKLKRPASFTGKVLHSDSNMQKMRYMLPCCEFSSGFVRPLKQAVFNIEDVQWKTESQELALQTMTEYEQQCAWKNQKNIEGTEDEQKWIEQTCGVGM